MKKMDSITKFWFENYNTKAFSPSLNQKVGGYCSLCGNSGIIDTRGRATTPTGEDIGKLNCCMCPNGRAQKKVEENRNKT